jgi:hypothetical protein
MIIPTCSSAARRTTSSASWPSAPQRAPVRLSQRATAPPRDGPARRRRPSAPASASGRPARPDASPPSRSREPGQLQVGQAAEVDRGGPGVAVRDHRPGGQHHLSPGAWRARAVGLAMDMTSTTTSTACHCQVIQRSPDRWDTTPCSGVRSDAGTCASNQARELHGPNACTPGNRRHSLGNGEGQRMNPVHIRLL